MNFSDVSPLSILTYGLPDFFLRTPPPSRFFPKITHGNVYSASYATVLFCIYIGKAAEENLKMLTVSLV